MEHPIPIGLSVGLQKANNGLCRFSRPQNENKREKIDKYLVLA